MKNLAKTFKAFIKDESGAELLEYAIVVIIVAALASVVWVIAGKARAKVEQAQSAIDNLGDIPTE